MRRTSSVILAICTAFSSGATAIARAWAFVAEMNTCGNFSKCKVLRNTTSATMAAPAPATAAAPKQLEDKAVWEGVEEDLPEDIKNGNAEDVVKATRVLENEIKSLKNEVSRLNLEHKREKERIKENNEKIKLNKQLPYLVGNVVEVRTSVIRRVLSSDSSSILKRKMMKTAQMPTLMHSGKVRAALSRPLPARYARAHYSVIDDHCRLYSCRWQVSSTQRLCDLAILLA